MHFNFNLNSIDIHLVKENRNLKKQPLEVIGHIFTPCSDCVAIALSSVFLLSLTFLSITNNNKETTV